MTDQPTNDEEETRKFREFHQKRMTQFAALQERLTRNDARLRLLESGGKSRGKAQWDSVRDDSDLLIGLVADWHLGHLVPDGDAHLQHQMEKVIERFPGYTPEKISQMADMSDATRHGYINQLQGYLGEQEIVDLINSGGIPVPKGYRAQLSGLTNEPGVDFRLVDGHGPIYKGQIKIGEAKSAVTDAFLHHPDVQIVVTNSELAEKFIHDPTVTVLHPGDTIPDHAHHIVMDSGFSKEHFRGFTEDFVNNSGHFSVHESLWKKIPIITAALIAIRAAHEYTFTDNPGDQIAGKAWRRLRDVFIARGIGEGLDLFVPGDHTGTSIIAGFLIMNSFRTARGNLERSTDMAHATRVFLSTFDTTSESRTSPNIRV